MPFLTDTTSVSTRSLGFFRIAIGTFLILIIFRIFPYRDIYFDHVKGVTDYNFPAKLFLAFWLIASASLAIGFQTRISALITYIFTTIGVTFFSMAGIGSFNDDVLRMATLLLFLFPSGRSFSIDALLYKVNHGKSMQQNIPRINIRLAVVLTIGLLYVGSGITKLLSPLWQQGLGLWVSYSIPARRWIEFSPFIDNKTVMQICAYFVIGWELLFVFLFFRKGWNTFFVLTGIGFHVMIGLVFPLYFFCIGPILCYTLFIPDSFWNWISNRHLIREVNRLLYSLSSAKVLSNLTSLLSPPIQTLTERNAMLKQQLFIGMAVIAISMQTVLQLYGAFTSLKVAEKESKQETESISYLKKTENPTGLRFDLSYKPTNWARIFFGINKRGLLLDKSTSGDFNAIQLNQVENNKEYPLPLYNENGYCASLNMDFGWNLYAHGYFLQESRTRLSPKGLKKFTAFWNMRHGQTDKNTYYKVYTKLYSFPDAFEDGYIDKMQARPWVHAANIIWENNRFYFEPIVKDSTPGN